MALLRVISLFFFRMQLTSTAFTAQSMRLLIFIAVTGICFSPKYLALVLERT